MTNLLAPGQQLNINDRLLPPSGRTVLIMQSDGNLVLYRVDNGAALFSSNTAGQPVTHAVMQADGNFVCYDANGHAHWATGTNGHPGAQLLIQDDGNLVVYGPGQTPLWASNTVQTWPPGPLTTAVPATQSPATPVSVTTVPVTLTVTPGVAITGTLSEPSISLPPTTPPSSGIALVGARGSLFSNSFDMPMINLERAIRQQTGLTDDDQLRAAIYARLVAIAATPNRTPDEQAVLNWLLQQVKNTRVEAARLALAEYDKWNYDPWDYIPPQGYDFPTYAIPARGSIMWATSSPNPPVLANTSWQSFFADIVSSNGWSPLNNPLLTKGQTGTSSSIENMIGFPTFGTALAYQKLYGTPDGVKALATSAHLLSSQSFSLAALLGGSAAQTVRLTYLEQLAPYSYRNLKALVQQMLKIRAGAVPVPAGDNPSIESFIKSLGSDELMGAARTITVGEALGNFVATFVLSVALQALIGEVISIITKADLRSKLAENLAHQQSAPLPDPSNLFYYDFGHGVDANTGGVVYYLAGDDDQPTDPVGLERRMGSQEAHRAFLLATL
jgi:hypothetical protein